MFVRPFLRDKGLQRMGRAGDGFTANPLIMNASVDAATTIWISMMLGGVYTRSGLTVPRTDTTESAANILAAMPEMDVGDVFPLLIANHTASALTIGAGAGITLSGNTVVAANSSQWFFFRKAGPAAMDCIGC